MFGKGVSKAMQQRNKPGELFFSFWILGINDAWHQTVGKV